MSRTTTGTTTRLWRVAGGLAIAHVALIMGGAGMETSPVLGDEASVMRRALVTSSLTTQFAGGYVECLGLLVLLLVGTLLARLVRGDGEVSGWLSSVMVASVAANVAVSLAAGLPAGAAAVYGGHHGVDLGTITTVTNIRDFSFYLSVAALGVFTLALSGAAQSTGLLPRALCLTGYVIGALSVASVPAASHGAVAVATMLWFVWFVAVGIVGLRGSRVSQLAATRVPVPA